MPPCQFRIMFYGKVMINKRQYSVNKGRERDVERRGDDYGNMMVVKKNGCYRWGFNGG